MSNILPTVGPATESFKNIASLLKFTKVLRLNGAHNTLLWHERVSKKIKKINPNSQILLDIPGVKARCRNKHGLLIKKGNAVLFYFERKPKISIMRYKNCIPLSSSLPQVKNNVKHFSVSDGKFKFRLISKGKNFIVGTSADTFSLKSNQGINIPLSIYNENYQKKNYFNFLRKYKGVKFDAIGISFVQSSSIIKAIKEKYPNKVIVSKLENFKGLKNLTEIIDLSDVIMIDRGDLAAEIGDKYLFNAIKKISYETKKNGKSLIIATENLESMIKNSFPTKSEIISLAFSKELEADKIMLSDETATSSNWKKTVKWLVNFLKEGVITNNLSSDGFFYFWKSISFIKNNLIIIFTKKGYAIDHINKIQNNNDLIVFTENKKIITRLNFRSNTKCFLTKRFAKNNIQAFVVKYIRKYKKIIFKNHSQAFLIHVSYPKKWSRANSLTLLSKKNI